MKGTMRRSDRARMLGSAILLGTMFAARAAYAGDPYMKPTAEELAMKELPGYPGASAVVLFREEIDHDDQNVAQHYERIKILTDEGKKYANIELGFVRTHDTTGYGSNEMNMGDIQGRTIHPDGTIIPFTGKPYLQTVENSKDASYQKKVFTLPDVEVGSIIEYRYAKRYADNYSLSPDWYIQGNLYVKSAHYMWYPTTKDLVDSKQREIRTISWFPVLPPGVKVEHTVLPNNTQTYEVRVKDVPPMVKEDYMPPVASFSYRVLFNFTSYHSGEEFWKGEGKDWSKSRDSFTNPKSELRDATQAVIAGATTQDEKLRKIYAAVMGLENTRYTRERGDRENKTEGGKINNTGDIWSHKRGSASELTELFVGMARAAGMNAYLMLVPDRTTEIFVPSWLSFQQFDDLIAIVTVDGKEQFFDPGSRYCPYGHLAWQHTLVRGLRQTADGTDFVQTPGDAYTVNRTTRTANLNMDEHGQLTGTIELGFTGAPALRWRHVALEGDSESLQRELQKSLEEMLPKTLEVKVNSILNLEDYEKALTVKYDIKGTMGAQTGKRLLMPTDLFVVNDAATFPHEKRELAVYYHYPLSVQDALRVNFHKGFAIEAVPTSARYDLPKQAIYTVDITSTPTSFTTRRGYVFGTVIVPTAEYPALRSFYSQFESKDKETVVLKVAPVEAASAGAAN